MQGISQMQLAAKAWAKYYKKYQRMFCKLGKFGQFKGSLG